MLERVRVIESEEVDEAVGTYTAVAGRKVKLRKPYSIVSKSVLIGAFAGPVLTDGHVYCSTELNELAAIGKNLAEQVDDEALDANIPRYQQEFASAFVGDGVGLIARRETAAPCSYSLVQVVAHAATRSAKKAKGYATALMSYICGTVLLSLLEWEGKWFVKLERLKPGKPPRFIFSCDKIIVALSRATNYPFEKWIKESYTTVKGLPTAMRYLPISEGCDKLKVTGLPYIVSIDCTARDANTKAHDFALYLLILRKLNLATPIIEWLCLYSSARGSSTYWKIRVKWVSLLSGVDFTSTINFITSYFGAYYYCTYVLMLPMNAWTVGAEGDDNCICISRPYAMQLLLSGRLPEGENSPGHVILVQAGLALGKRWKTEYAGWLDDPHGHPFVGGTVLYDDGAYHFFPSYARFLLKAGVVLARDVISPKCLMGRIIARADALTDRFDRYPIGWVYANLVRAHAACYNVRVLRTKEEEYEELASSKRRIAREPGMTIRVLFERHTGITVGRQFALEGLLNYCIRTKDYTPDMRAVFCRL